MTSQPLRGQVFFRGKYIPVSVIDGERFIDGKTVDEFQKTLTPEEVITFAKAGKIALEYEKRGKLTEPGRIQYEVLK